MPQVPLAAEYRLGRWPRVPAESAHATSAHAGSSDMTIEIRRDALPENANYPDTGCGAIVACLDCPLPACLEDEKSRQGLIVKSTARRELIRERINGGLTVEQVSIEFNVSERTVHRAVSTGRNPVGRPPAARKESD